MNQTLPLPRGTAVSALPRCRAVALLVDGQTTSPALAERCRQLAHGLGPLSVQHVYGDPRSMGAWLEAPGFRVIHAHTGRNVTDTLMRVEALQLGLGGLADGIVLASSDRDLVPVVMTLRARGIPVLGLVGPDAPALFRQSCTAVVELAPPAQPRPRTRAGDRLRAAVLASLCGRSLSPQEFGRAMARHGHCRPEGVARWEDYLRLLGPVITITGEGEAKRFCLTI